MEKELSLPVSRFIETNIDLISMNDFDSLYYKANIQLVMDQVAELTYAFYASNINFLPLITAIHSNMFYGLNKICDGVFMIPENIKTIESFAFAKCYSTKTLHLPRSLIFIAKQAFYQCSSLKTIYYHGTAENWRDDVSRQVYWDDGLPPGCDVVSYIDGEVLYTKK